MNSIYDDLSPIMGIPELKGWDLTTGLQIELEDKYYHVWDPQTGQNIRLGRGTGSCAWGWGALLKRPKPSVLSTVVSLCYPMLGMLYGLKDKLRDHTD